MFISILKNNEFPNSENTRLGQQRAVTLLTHSALVMDICVVWLLFTNRHPLLTCCFPLVNNRFLNHLISPLFVCCLDVGEQQAFQKIIFTVVPSLFGCWWSTGDFQKVLLSLFVCCSSVVDQQERIFLTLFTCCLTI